MRQADCVAARPAAGCSRLQSFICCRPTIPQVWPGMSSAGLKARRAGTGGIHGVRLLLGNERSKGKRRNPFHGRGRAAKGRPCRFFVETGSSALSRVSRVWCFEGRNGCLTNKHKTHPKSGKMLYRKAKIIYALCELEDAVPEICRAAAGNVAQSAFLKESDFCPRLAGSSASASRGQSIKDFK